MKNKKVIYGSIAVVALVAVFFGGMKYGEAQGTRAGGQFARGNFAGAGNGTVQFGRGQAGGAAGRGGAGLTIGTILSKDATSITVGVQGGGSKIVFTGASTTISQMAAGTLDDLQTGTNVMVQGTPNSDGSMTAQSIQIRPAGQMPQEQGSAQQQPAQ
jgi:hypothetical protein